MSLHMEKEASYQFFTLGLVAEDRNVLQMQGITMHFLDFSAFPSPGREGGSLDIGICS